jgi:hypothetical protein
MAFYGGRTGQHFYIAEVFQSKAAMLADESIYNNQFVLLTNSGNNNEDGLYIKSHDEFLYVGPVGSFAPSINSDGEWSLGDISLNENARAYKLYLKIPYDSSTNAYIPDVSVDENGDIKETCYIKYAYAKEGTPLEEIPDSSWTPLVEITGLHTLNEYVTEFTEAKTTVAEKTIETEANAYLVKILTELNKSYVHGDGVFTDDMEIPEEYQNTVKERTQ